MSGGPRGLLVIAFGGPHKSEDVRPFLRHVLAGRPVPEERFEAVVHHYELLGGASPITRHTEDQAAALKAALAERGIALELRIGMRHWTPWILEALLAFQDLGIDSVLGLIMAAQETEASVARYVQAVEAARAQLGENAPAIRYVHGWGLSEGVIDAHADHVSRAFAALPEAAREQASLLFTAHSIPAVMAAESPYVAQLEATARRVAQKVGIATHRLVYQSRSGSPREPWLEPDVLDVLDEEAKRGVKHVVLAPIGFLCDHVEVLYDLDIEAKQRASELGLTLVRAATLGTHPAFIAALAEAVAREHQGAVFRVHAAHARSRHAMKVAVVGGGISGLSAAYRLREAGVEVAVLEGGERAGGLLGTECFDGYVVETGADSILTEKPWAMKLAENLGIGSHVIKTRSQSRGAYIVHDGKLERVPEGFSLMAPTNLVEMAKSPIVSRRGKLRMLGDLVLPRGGSADESLESFVVRRLGRELFERLAQPLVGGIYGADPKKLSLAATMPRFVEMEHSHRSLIRGLTARQKAAAEKQAGQASGARYGMFAAFDGGMQTLIDALTRTLGERIQTRALVTAVEHDQYGFSVEVHGSLKAFDAVIVAVPAHVAGQMLHGLDAALARELFAIDYASAATVTFAWPRQAIPHPLDAFGFVVPAVENRQIIASTWASVKYDGRAPDDKALIRVFIGGHTGQHLLERADEDLIGMARRELAQLIGVTAEPEFTKVVRYPKAMPQYHVGHLERVARIEALVAQHPRFALAGNAYRGVGIPDAVRSGEQAAQRILAT